MKFEKINKDKIQITLNLKDLEEKNIDFHLFMSNPIESQHILLDMLDEAKEKIGFDTNNYNIKVEALAMAESDFIFTITRVLPETTPVRKKAKVQRKKISTNKLTTIFRFNSFDNYCLFLNSLSLNSITKNKHLLKSCILYTYNNNYYLCLVKKENINIALLDKLYFSLIEFSNFINNSDTFHSKLKECGKIIIKNNAIEIGYTYFAKK